MSQKSFPLFVFAFLHTGNVFWTPCSYFILIIDSVALLFILNAAHLLLNSVTFLLSGSGTLLLIDSFLNCGTFLLRHLSTVGSVAHTALGVRHRLALLSVGHITNLTKVDMSNFAI